MSFRILEHLGIDPVSVRLSSPALDCPSGAVIGLDINAGVLRVVAPGSYAFEVGHVIETAGELRYEDLRFICRAARVLLSVFFDGTVREHHKALAERQWGNIEQLVARAMASDSSVLIVAPSSILMPLLADAFPTEVFAPLVARVVATAAPLVLLVNRELLATTLEYASKGFTTVASGLRTPERGIMPVIHAVTAIGEHVGVFLVPVPSAPSDGKERPS